MRQQYETEIDRKNEKTLALHFIKSKWPGLNLYPKKLPISYIVDYAVVQAETLKIASFFEAKTRTCGVNDFQTYMISLTKVLQFHKLQKATGIPCCLVVGWSDDARFWKFIPGAYEIKYGGRTVQTRDSADIEPVAHIPIKDFSRI